MYGEHGPWCDYRWVPDLRTGLIYMLAGPGLMLAVGGLMDWSFQGLAAAATDGPSFAGDGPLLTGRPFTF
jgi:hypothetical protein